MATAERQMVTVTNQVGVDLSQLHSHEWRQATLPYVAGLGPRKARALLRTLAASDAPTTRKALKETLGEVRARLPLNPDSLSRGARAFVARRPALLHRTFRSAFPLRREPHMPVMWALQC